MAHVQKPLTSRQSQVLHYLENYQKQHGRAPTLQEICDHFGFRSLSSAQDHLRLIAQKGFLTTKPHCSRSIRIVRQETQLDGDQIVLVPLVGKVAAGTPIFALEEKEGTLALPKSLFRGPELFALRVHGDSMIKAGIFDNDIAVLKSQPVFSDGDIAAVVVDEEATLKRVYRTAKGLRLHPENDAYDTARHPADAGNFQRERTGSPLLRSRFDSGFGHHCDRRLLGSALTAVSGDSSSEHDHSPGSLPVADSGRDTGGLTALPPAPTPPSAHSLPPPSAPARPSIQSGGAILESWLRAAASRRCQPWPPATDSGDRSESGQERALSGPRRR